MKKMILVNVLALLLFTAKAQFRTDNVLYRTVYPENLCTELSSAKDYLLLDVRSPMEFSDEPSGMGLQFGHLKNAVNINVKDLGKRLSEIKDYKDKPVYVYCSHSQRSRRASRMLADSGFTKVVNINGGITAILQLPPGPCKNDLLVGNVPYRVISPVALCNALTGYKAKTFLLDVRSDSAYFHIDKDPEVNSIGTFRSGVHIPAADLEKRINEVPQGKDIIIIDVDDNDGAKAAQVLLSHGFKNISALQEGLDRFLEADPNRLSCIQSEYVSPVRYHVLSAYEFGLLSRTSPGYIPLDIRTDDEFNNKSKDDYRNIGHLKNAVHIPTEELPKRSSGLDKNKPFVIYGFSASKTAYEAANYLTAQGFTDLYLLRGGIFNLRWTAANVFGYQWLNGLVIDVPKENY